MSDSRRADVTRPALPGALSPTRLSRRYHVEVDSSVLGPACDSYEHIYEEVRAQEHEPAVFEMDLGRSRSELGW